MPERTAISIRTLSVSAAVAAAASAIGNLALLAIARGGLGMELVLAVAPDSPELAPLPVQKVVLASVLPALVGAVLLALIARFTARPMRFFGPLAAVVLVLSMGGPASIPVEEPATSWILGLMHVISAVAIVGVLAAMTRRGR